MSKKIKVVKSFAKGSLKIKKPTKSTQTAILTGVVLITLTLLIYFVINTILPKPKNIINDWRYTWAKSPDQLYSQTQQYKLASTNNKITKEFGKKYIRLTNTLPRSSEDRRLTIKTAYNPIKIELNGSESLNDGYGQNSFTASSYKTITIPAGTEYQLDIYMYVPLAFDFNAKIDTVAITASEAFYQYIGFGFSLAVILIGMAMLVLSIMLATGSTNLRRLLLLSITIFIGGITALLYSFSSTTSLLSSPFWFPILMLLQLFLLISVYITILSCYNQALKNAVIFIPIAILCIIVPLFATGWAIRITAAAITIAQLYILVKTHKVLLNASSSDIPHLGTVRGLLYYAVFIEVYNTVCLFLATKLLSGYLFVASLIFFCIVVFVIFCRQIIYLDIKKYERIRQIYANSAWIEDITNFVFKVFNQKKEDDFLIEVAKNLSTIFERHCQINDDDIDVHACVGVYVDNENYSEIYNNGDIKDCDYNSIAAYLDSQEQKLLIGNTTVDMLFTQNEHRAVIHFENVKCGITSNLQNIVKTAYINLYSSYQNLNTQNDMSTMQEELFINLATIAEQKNKETKSHQIIVSALSYELCIRLGMGQSRAKVISLAAMVHDIGKIVIPETILTKEQVLSDEEYQIMKMHTTYGYNILSLNEGDFFKTAANIALQHHENFDGTGYLGKKGREIDAAARIVHVVDVFDALLSKRSYKQEWSVDDAVNYIISGRAIQFDPAVVDVFSNCYDELVKLREYIISEDIA